MIKVMRYKLRMNFDLKRAFVNTRAYFETLWNRAHNVYFVEVINKGGKYTYRKYGDGRYVRLLEEHQFD